jgi:AcrR family transcriptional regulator
MALSKGEETRRSILGAALSLASEVGLEGLSIGLLSERVGMSKSGLFAHFSSKENLQVAVLDEAVRRFVDLVIAPALREARGEPRVQALFARWLEWGSQSFMPGGCVLMAAAFELDDRPGPARDRLLASQKDLRETLAQAVRIAKSEGHFRSDLDEHQLVFEVFGIVKSFYFHHRLFRDHEAQRRARTAFERLMRDARQQH